MATVGLPSRSQSHNSDGESMNRAIHPIETASYEIIRTIVDSDALPPRTRDVVNRIVHATADPRWIDDLVASEDALVAGVKALASGAPAVVDVTMVSAGITQYPTSCLLNLPTVQALSVAEGITRSAAAFRLAAERFAGGAVWVVGNSPTALLELLRLAAAGHVRPVLIIGLPVGYVGAVEAKAALRTTSLPQLSNISARGGSSVAAAAVNALLYGDPLA
jgi:precorrin-8X/cobalt-precorrin-8 methylmutase